MSASAAFTTAISALRWAYRVLVLAGLAAGLVAYLQARDGLGPSGTGSYSADIEQALSGLKELARALQ